MADKHRRLYFVVVINNIYLTYYNTNGYKCWYISIDFNFENILLLITDFSNIKFDIIIIVTKESLVLNINFFQFSKCALTGISIYVIS